MRYTPSLFPGDPGQLEALGLWAGQGVGLVTRIQPAREIVRELAEGAERVFRHCAGMIQVEEKTA
jgi:NAD(P)H-dependent flavin oxidoreductase YrpB (nitropropane dioxygenase family)